MNRFSKILLVSMCVNLTSFGLSQTTGKLAGTIVDKQSKNPLPGANIILEKISYGAATDERGQFHIINIPPGMYSVSIMMIGYKTVKVNDVRISIFSIVSDALPLLCSKVYR